MRENETVRTKAQAAGLMSRIFTFLLSQSETRDYRENIPTKSGHSTNQFHHSHSSRLVQLKPFIIYHPQCSSAARPQSATALLNVQYMLENGHKSKGYFKG